MIGDPSETAAFESEFDAEEDRRGVWWGCWESVEGVPLVSEVLVEGCLWGE
jgi:hypothetical protein